MRIAIFGTTGAGKTTLLENLKKLLDKKYVFVNETSLDCPYFNKAYDDSNSDVQDYNYKLDLWMLTDRMKTFIKYKNHQNVIYDRSILDSMVFSQTDHMYNRLDGRDYNVFKDYFLTCILPNIFDCQTNNKIFDIVIYLKVEPHKAIRRINKRSRDVELDTNDLFWLNLTKAYEFWYDIYKEVIPFWVIDANVDDPSYIANMIANKIKDVDNKID
ncbi:deoxynucleoside kinase [Mycoplasma capricolum subsp. capripneumoniae]|uniref:deoxynucleoside kinase n=1 Tax=Mycoplasma capricolum TaxID=2095 RepID=UPI0004D7AED0|nr:deoxynucleoside kinase [Mycoplasma capricolum]KEY84613.1 Deoxynucleoside kinase [Mycoplasma capricolum subsp. capripneumoniae 99108]QDL19688.1 deoxynucleoside kinase [Mycoplasma capricolum subsp. capripneumoniae]QDL20373.1 deoxynucleoside kinase [Mycoplasma capricolum subsp. capripneumoniae]QDL21060.1 deoxynucleoside kinase [Mycoplasma capricolum subsp. capripneumoniae]QIF40328.1 deoxynucleoside kinase [Mycoplasma capricolum subsp. capripneumoniae]